MNQTTIIILIVIAVIVFILLYLLARQFNRFFRLGCFFPALVAGCGVIALLIGGSLFFDLLPSTGGRVISRSEEILSGSGGNWRRSMKVTVEYGGEDDNQSKSAEFHVDGQSYDRLIEGGPAEVRLITLGDTLAITRLAEMNTISLAEQAWAGIRLWLPFSPSDQRHSAPATIRAITYIEQEFSTDEDGTEVVTRLFQPVEVVEFEFNLADRSEPIIAVEKIDAGSLDLKVGGRAQAQYIEENPRAAMLAEATHAYRWQNPLAQLAPGIVIIVIIAIVGTLWHYVKRIIGLR